MDHRLSCGDYADKLMVRQDLLSAEEQDALQEHLNKCPKCATQYREYQRIIEDLQDLTATLHVPDSLAHLQESGSRYALNGEEHVVKEGDTNTRGVEVRIVVHRPAEKMEEPLLRELEGAELRIEELVKRPLRKVLGREIKVEVSLRTLEDQEQHNKDLLITTKKYTEEEKAIVEDTRQVLFCLPFFTDTVSKEALSATSGLTENRLNSVLDRLVELDLLRPKEELRAHGLYYSIKPRARPSIRKAQLHDKSWFDEEPARLRWGKYYVDFVASNLWRKRHEEDYWNSLVSRNLARIDLEWPNLSKILPWAYQQGQDQLLVDLMTLLVHYMDRRLLHLERLDYAQKAAKAAGRLGLSKREALFHIDALGWTLIEEGDLEDAVREIKTGEDIVRNLANTREIFALARAYLARVSLAKGDMDDALAFINEAGHIKSSSVIQCRVKMVVGDIARACGEYKAGLEYYEQVHRESELYSDKEDGFEADYRLGLAYLENDMPVQAEKMFRAVIDREQKEGVTIELLYAKYGMARVALANMNEAEFHRLVDEVEDALSRAHTSHRLQAVLADLNLAKLTELDPTGSRLPKLRAQELAKLAQEQSNMTIEEQRDRRTQ